MAKGGGKKVAAPKVKAVKKTSGSSGCKASSSKGSSNSKGALAIPTILGGDLASPAEKKRRLNRRDTDEQVKRVITKRLIPDYGSEVVSASRDSDNCSIHMWLALRLRACKNSQKYVTAEIIGELVQHFKLGESDALEVSSEDNNLDEDLCEALALARHKNPAERKTIGVQKFFEYCDKVLTKYEVAGFLNAIKECPMVVRASSATMHWSFLQYAARICDTKYLVVFIYLCWLLRTLWLKRVSRDINQIVELFFDFDLVYVQTQNKHYHV